MAEHTSIVDIVTASGCAKADIPKAVKALKDAGIADLKDLPATKADAEAKLKGILDAAVPASSAKIRAALMKAWAAGAVKESVTVPPGRIDIASPTFPTLKAEDDHSFTVFKIPATYVAKVGANDPYIAPADLEPWQWLYIAAGNSLSKAVNLRAVLAGTEAGSALAARPAFLWEPASGYFEDTSSGIEDSLVAVTIDQRRLHAHALVEGSITGGFTFCPVAARSASIEASIAASYEADTTVATYAKRVYTRARFTQSRCILRLDRCLHTSPAFEHILDVALSKPDAFDALEQVFEAFGHVIPAMVILGGVMQFDGEVISLAGRTLKETKQAVNSSIQFKMGDTAKAGVKVGYAESGSDSVTSESLSKQSTMDVVGGDPRRVGDPAAWKASVNDSGSWRIVGRSGLIPVTDILKTSNAALFSRFEKAVRAKREQGWGLPAASLPDASRFLLPHFDAGHGLTLANWGDSVERPASAYLRATSDVTSVPDAGAFDERGTDGEGNAVPLNRLAGRETGVYYANCQPAPLRAAESAGNNPKDYNLLWTLLYTGKQTDHGEPIYWLVTQDGLSVLSGFNVTEYAPFASLYPLSQERTRSQLSTYAQWVLRPALSIGRVTIPTEVTGGDAASQPRYFRLWNPRLRGYLAGEALFNWHRKFVQTDRVAYPGVGWGPPAWMDEPVVHDSLLGNGFDQHELDATGQRRAAKHVGVDGGMQRTLIQTDAAAVLASVYKPTGSIDESNVTEAAAKKAYQKQCWRIQDCSPRRERVPFPELDALDDWEREREQKKA